LDLAILKFLNLTIANPYFDFFFKYIGDFDLWRWPIGLVLLLILWKGGAKGRWLVLAAALTIAIVDPSIHYILKPVFARLRPCKNPDLAGWLRVIDGCGGRYGFPSNHAANMMSIAVVATSFYRNGGYYLFPLAAIVAVSRVYLGVHYPLDIVAGAAYGAGFGLLVAMAIKALASKRTPDYLHARI
jgi:undecaprenyl-diphosphatase